MNHTHIYVIWETAKYNCPCILKYYRKFMFMFRPTTLKQFNSLPTIATLSCLSGLNRNIKLSQWSSVGLRCRVWLPTLSRICRLAFSFCCFCAFTFWSKILCVMNYCNAFCNVIIFTILNYLILYKVCD